MTAVGVAGASSATRANAAPAPGAAQLPSALPPTAQTIAAETATPQALNRIGGRPGSDYMVDVINTLGIKYPAGELRLELPRHPRVADQLRQEHHAGVPHLHP